MFSNHPKRVMHISGAALLTKSGYSQQILMEVTALKKSGYDVNVLALCHLKLFRDIDSIRAHRREYNERGLKIYILPTLFSGRMLLEILYYPVIWLFMSYFIFIKRIRIFHCHHAGLGFTLLVFRFFRLVKLFIDVHGVVTEERIYRRELKEKSFSHRYANLKEKLTFRYSDMTFCVSEKMISYYMEKHHLPKNRFALTRSTFDPDIFGEFSWDIKKNAKKRLNLQDKYVLLYMGHKQLWQLTDDVIRLFAELRNKISNVFIIILTNDIDGIKKAFERVQIPEQDYLVKYVPHDEVPLYSYASDIGIIIRDDSIVNRTASPVKVSESLASGATLLVSDSVGDVPALIEKHNIGYVISNGSDGNLISFLSSLFLDEKNRQDMSERCRYIAEQEFSVWRTVKVFSEYYGA